MDQGTKRRLVGKQLELIDLYQQQIDTTLKLVEAVRARQYNVKELLTAVMAEDKRRIAATVACTRADKVVVDPYCVPVEYRPLQAPMGSVIMPRGLGFYPESRVKDAVKRAREWISRTNEEL